MLYSDEKKNVISLVTKDSLSSLSQTFVSVSIVQAYLLSLGFENFELGVLNTMTNVGLMLGVFLFMGRIDAIKSNRLVSTNSNLFISIGILPVTLILLSLFGGTVGNTGIFLVLGVAWAIQSFFSGIRTMTDSRLCRDIFRPETYGFAFGIDGMIFNTIGIMGALLIRFIINNLNGESGYRLVFILSLILVPGPVIFSRRLRMLKPHDAYEETKAKSPISSFSYAFKDKTLRNISYLHIVRGILSGMFIFILPLGVSRYEFPLSYAAFIIVVNAVAGMLGYFFIHQFYDKIGTMKSIVLGTLACLLGVAGLVLFRMPLTFLLFYALYYYGFTIIMQSIPMGIYKVVPMNAIGTLTGVRFIIMQSAEAVVAFTLGAIIGSLSIPLFFAIAAVFLLLQFWFSKCSFTHKGVEIDGKNAIQ